ncbi:SUMO-activating enzyme subunit 2 [Lasiodiplodia hormozganensis]|uniref:Ubiquitin-activating enzyme E1-like n=1 Tax=Lasiodiplodia hormozganensis TaxID=869390 RepID=A0AA40D1X9_9PEZI|nr:SUMO-activating enzyme subunit 2 [Lasiodiplodia hormozganensis]
MARDKFAKQSLGASLHAHIKESRVLMVGAGGIGCELLKNLVLTGFGNIHIVDLDTIDLSNLNRQFLFRHEHIKKSKALVAKESAGKFNPNVNIEAHHANVKDPQFNVDWFKGFSLVFNALDNLDARRHVNKMCLAADVPLIESGTTGFNGQVQVIKKGKTECYDCNVKETPKSFPVCTIRSTPSQPIHCIVWAKSYLFTEIFGISEDDAPELDHTEDSENREEIENLRKEAQALKSIRQSMGSESFPRKVFEKVFKEDIERLLSMKEMWAHRRAPEPLDWEKISQHARGAGSDIARSDQAIWTVGENFAVFNDSIRRLSARLEELKANTDTGNAPPVLSFDKDDVDTLDFVAAAANLRSCIFGIETRSKFDIKQMAGNIIPAIATTNAMTAGLCVLQAFKVMRDDYDKARMVFLTRSTDRVLTAENLHPPKPECPVCSVAQTKLVVDTSRATLKDLVEDFLRLELGYGEEFSVNSDAGVIYDPELDDNLPKKFSEIGLKADSFVTVIDEEDENPRVNLVLSITEQTLPEDAKPIHLPEKLEIPYKPKTAHGEPSELNGNGAVVTNGVDGQRKRTAETAGLEEDEKLRKRGKVAEEPSAGQKSGGPDDVIVIDDNAPITIDD